MTSAQSSSQPPGVPRWVYYLLAVTVAIGFVLPSYGQFFFSQLADLIDTRFPLALRIQLAYPTLTMLAIPLVVWRSTRLRRAILLCAIAMPPILLALIDTRSITMVQWWFPLPGEISPALIFAACAWGAMFIGSGVLTFGGRPRVGAIISAVGAVALLFYLVLPVLPAEEGWIPGVAPLAGFLSSEYGQEAMADLGALMVQLLTLLACLLCFVSLRKPPKNYAYSKGAFACLVGSLAVAGLFAWGIWVPLEHAVDFITFLSYAFWIVPLLLLLPLALIDLIIWLTRPPDVVGHAFAVVQEAQPIGPLPVAQPVDPPVSSEPEITS